MQLTLGRNISTNKEIARIIKSPKSGLFITEVQNLTCLPRPEAITVLQLAAEDNK
jgi:hypothetical protein